MDTVLNKSSRLFADFIIEDALEQVHIKINEVNELIENLYHEYPVSPEEEQLFEHEYAELECEAYMWGNKLYEIEGYSQSIEQEICFIELRKYICADVIHIIQNYI